MRAAPQFMLLCLVLFACSQSSKKSIVMDEMHAIRLAADSVKKINVVYHVTRHKKSSGFSSYVYAQDSVSGNILYYTENRTTGYFNREGKIMLIEIANIDAVYPDIHLLDEYFLRDEIPFYHRSFTDSVLTMEDTVSAIPDYYSFEIMQASKFKKIIDDNSLNLPELKGIWYEVKEVQGDKNYELTRVCGGNPLMVTVDDASVSVNPGQMANLYSVLSTKESDINLTLMAVDSVSDQPNTVEFIIAPHEPGIVLWRIDGEFKFMVHEKSLELVTIKDDNSDCENM